MQGLGFEDRRMFTRFMARAFLGYLDITSQKKGRGRTYDISGNGIGLITNQKLPPATPLDIWLKIPDNSDSLYVKGEVIWIKEIKFRRYRVGISLEEPELMGISRIINAAKSKKKSVIERMWLCLIFPRKNKP